ncbi:MAG TPA: TlpA disulfide reductase family protein [Acidimicrobiales bacterium]|nr:TlpA disulfide reductase family protein [Acidimicrobiales bacterium]
MSTPTPRAARARAAAKHRTPEPSPRTKVLPIVALVVVGLIAVGIALLSGGGDDSDDGGTALSTAEVTVRGEALPPLGDGQDPAVGTPAPELEGVSVDGTPTNVEPAGRPTLLAFLAHWCPHCQAELPRLVDLADAGELDDLRAVAVLTGTDESRPNFPPGEWIEDEGWEGEVLLDDADQPAAAAYGLSSYPFLVLLDADGNVVARSAGELGMEGLEVFLAQLD